MVYDEHIERMTKMKKENNAVPQPSYHIPDFESFLWYAVHDKNPVGDDLLKFRWSMTARFPKLRKKIKTELKEEYDKDQFCPCVTVKNKLPDGLAFWGSNEPTCYPEYIPDATLEDRYALLRTRLGSKLRFVVDEAIMETIPREKAQVIYNSLKALASLDLISPDEEVWDACRSFEVWPGCSFQPKDFARSWSACHDDQSPINL